ncbi:MAG: PIN domain-containing protein [Deltaproteobacteria bacterium]|nr:PIN domain-containing protein [Deltaproteobacteria bacterium]
MILLDTDICIELLRGNANVIEKRKGYDEKVTISFMSVAELFYGAEKSDNAGQNTRLIEEFLLTIEVIHSDIDILRKFGELKAILGSAGNILADADIFIAATTLAKCNMLITGNVNHFRRIEELKIENWIR